MVADIHIILNIGQNLFSVIFSSSIMKKNVWICRQLEKETLREKRVSVNSICTFLRNNTYNWQLYDYGLICSLLFIQQTDWFFYLKYWKEEWFVQKYCEAWHLFSSGYSVYTMESKVPTNYFKQVFLSKNILCIGLKTGLFLKTYPFVVITLVQNLNISCQWWIIIAISCVNQIIFMTIRLVIIKYMEENQNNIGQNLPSIICKYKLYVWNNS